LTDSPLRRLPPVHALLDRPVLAELVTAKGRGAIVEAARAAISEARHDLEAGREIAVDADTLARRAAALVVAERPALRALINATGILLNTNLGRAPLAPEAAEAVDRVVRGYCNLEYDLERGVRGERTTGVEALLRRLTGADAAAVVNNNAGATVLALRALAAGREVLISRGQLIEIGGGFRLPEVFEVSGVRLHEVGTTNRTRLSDYARAIGPETAAILRVHPSNYRIVGFSEDVAITDLALLAHQHGLVAIDDIGSGALAPGCPPDIHEEPTAAEGIAAGADVVLFSGDKLLGGPQSGIMLGKCAAIDRIRSDPLMRALRVDKMTLAALEATLRLMLDPTVARARIPLWSFLTTPVEKLRVRAERLAASFRDPLGLSADVIDSTAYLGGGSTPVAPIPSVAVRLSPPLPPRWNTETAFAQALRLGIPPVISRLQGGCLLFDLRALNEPEDGLLEEALRRLLGHPGIEGEATS
jgi:L-seryl-tRNA(Ser) seleniumtransferase